MKTGNVVKALILGSCAMAGLFFALDSSSGKKETGPQAKVKKPPVVEVTSATTGEMSRDLELTGSVEPYRIARLASPAEGPIREIRVREGDRVKAGAALLTLGRKEAVEARIAALREEVKKEEANLRRTRRLVDSGALPDERLDQVLAEYEKDRAELVEAEETAQDYVITAPWDGVIHRLLVKEGEFVASCTKLLEMYDSSSLLIQAAVPEEYAVEVGSDMPVEIRLDAYPGEVMKGRIERVYPYLDPRLRTRTIEVLPVKPVDLLPGMFARLKVSLETVKAAVVVPREAVVSQPSGNAVFVMENGKAFRRPVKIGIEERNLVQIVKGVQLGDKVIISGNAKLKDGREVRLLGKAGSGKSGNPQSAGESDGQERKPEGGRQ